MCEFRRWSLPRQVNRSQRRNQKAVQAQCSNLYTLHHSIRSCQHATKPTNREASERTQQSCMGYIPSRTSRRPQYGQEAQQQLQILQRVGHRLSCCPTFSQTCLACDNRIKYSSSNTKPTLYKKMKSSQSCTSSSRQGKTTIRRVLIIECHQNFQNLGDTASSSSSSSPPPGERLSSPSPPATGMSSRKRLLLLAVINDALDLLDDDSCWEN
jgi:hypothetical protein